MSVLVCLFAWSFVGGFRLPDPADHTAWAFAFTACLIIECTRVRRWYRSLP